MELKHNEPSRKSLRARAVAACRRTIDLGRPVATPSKNELARLETAVRGLRRTEREIFLAYRLDGMSYAEIAARTGLSATQVERHMASAIYKICDAMLGPPRPWWRRWF